MFATCCARAFRLPWRCISARCTCSSSNKWYFDELYDRLFVRSAFSLGEGLWKTGDGTLIDGLGPDGISAATRELAARGKQAADRITSITTPLPC